MRFAVALVTAIVLLAVFRRVRRLHDPSDYLSLSTGFEPRFPTARFTGFDAYDKVTYDAGMLAMREFSRHYQSSFLAGATPSAVIDAMARCRRDFVREMHALRMWLPNDAPLERRLLAGIEETDAAMAAAMAVVAERFPETKLKHGAGANVRSTLRAKDDVWN